MPEVEVRNQCDHAIVIPESVQVVEAIPAEISAGDSVTIRVGSAGAEPNASIEGQVVTIPMQHQVEKQSYSVVLCPRRVLVCSFPGDGGCKKQKTRPADDWHPPAGLVVRRSR